MMMRRLVTAMLHFVNQTPMDWNSKKQANVKTVMHGLEFAAAQTCVEQIIDLQNTLC
jgi:hypothetical protein